MAFFCVFDLKKNTDKAIEMMKAKGSGIDEESHRKEFHAGFA